VIDTVARQDTPPPVQHPEGSFNKSPMPPSLEDNSGSKVNSRRRGRPRNQIPAVTTNHLTIEPKRELRKRGPVSVQTDDDPWAKLSKAPSVTPASPRKVPQPGPSRQKPVIYLSCYTYKTL
jgi:hypothetical protein